MKQRLYFLLAITFISASSTFAQKRIVENAMQDAKFVAASWVKTTDDRKPCAITNVSLTRTITVRVQESVVVNDELKQKVTVYEKIMPNEKRFLGFAGCEAKPKGGNWCTGYKILLAYYEDGIPRLPLPEAVVATDIKTENDIKAIRNAKVEEVKAENKNNCTIDAVQEIKTSDAQAITSK